MTTSPIRVLVVDDYEPWRRFVRLTFQIYLKLQVIGEAADGLEAVQKAQELRPDLIVLDIGLPTLNGIEAARRIRVVSPQSKILFISENRSWDIAEEALRTGADGYVVKSDAASDLIPAVEAVLQGKRFVSAGLAGRDPANPTNTPNYPGRKQVPVARDVGIARRHEAHFYSDDASFLDACTQFIGAALKAGNAAIVVATASHRDSLLPRLQAYNSNMASAMEEGRYISLDAADMLSTLIVNDQPDPARFLETARALITTAARTAKVEHPRVAICGECDPPLWAMGDGEAAVRLEQLWNEIAVTYDVDILCGYPLGSLHEQGSHLFQRICAEHSAVYSR